MLASIFIVQGYDTMRRPERVVKKAEPVVRPIADRVLVRARRHRAGGAAQRGGPARGRDRCWRSAGCRASSALAIAATLVPTTAAGHRFWEASDEQERAQQRIHFLKNLAMFGGLLIAAGDTARAARRWPGGAGTPCKSARRDMSLAAKTARKSGKAAAKATRIKGQLPVG